MTEKIFLWPNDLYFPELITNAGCRFDIFSACGARIRKSGEITYSEFYVVFVIYFTFQRSMIGNDRASLEQVNNRTN